MDLSIPLSVVLAIASTVAAVATTWGVFRKTVSGLETKVGKLEEARDKDREAIHELQLAFTKQGARLSDISELKSTAVREDVFRIRMNAQDDVLLELRNLLDRKVSVSSMPAASVPSGAQGLPPMRPRLPSRPR